MYVRVPYARHTAVWSTFYKIIPWTNTFGRWKELVQGINL